MISLNMFFMYGVASLSLIFSLLYLILYFFTKRIIVRDTLFAYGSGLFFSTFIYVIGEVLLGYYRSLNLIPEMIFWQKIEHIGVYFSMFFVLFYVLRAAKVVVSRKVIITTLLAVVVVVGTMLFTDLVITDRVRGFNGCTIIGSEGPLYFITHLMILVFVGLSYIYIAKSIRKCRGEERSGLLLIFIGLIIGSIGAIFDVLGTIVDVRFLAKVSVFSYSIFIMGLLFIVELGRRLFTNVQQLYKANLKIKKQDDALARSAKLDMVGKLVSGVLHDLRNAISFISLSNDNLEIITENDLKINRVVLRQQESIEMSVVLLDNLSSFATGKIDVGDDFSRFSPYVVIRKMEKLLSGKMKKFEVKFKFKVSNNLFLAGKPSLFMQVLFNLFLNSIDSMKGGGNIEIVQEELDGKELVAFNFIDNGIGISQIAKKQIFDFLFTTKESGSGLGLYITRRIVVASGGSIKVIDSPSGTTFQILWPLVY